MSNLIVTENILAPGIRPLESMEELRNWKSQNERSNIARIPLAKRTNRSALAIPTMAGFDCGEFAFDPWFTAWSQGAQGTGADGNRTAANVYNFSYWQYIDISYYLSHNLATIPPTVWTNACHKNGVLSLGTLNLNLDDSHGKFNKADVIAFLTPKAGSPDPEKVHLEEAIMLLKDVASYFGFDGWLFNVEDAYPSLVNNMLTMLSTLKSEGCYTAWYDSPFSNGVGYANRLTEKGWPFLKNANSFQANYWWNKSFGYPKQSYDVIAANAPDTKLEERDNMFMSKYCSKEGGTPPYTDPAFFDAFDSIKTPDPPQPGDPPKYWTGLGVYYPAWDMYDMRATNTGKNTDKLPDRETFHHNDQAFWTGTKDSIIFPNKTLPTAYNQCMRNYIEERSVIQSLPFVTCFNDGEGDYYNLAGRNCSTGPWNNLSDQSVLPTYRFFFNYDGMRKNKTAIAHPSDPNLVYSGGSCLSVDFDGQGGLAIPLFKTEVPVPAQSQISLVRKQTNVAYEFLLLSFSDGSSAGFKTPRIQNLQNGWQRAIYDLTDDLVGKVVTDISIELLKAAPGDATYYLGQFSFAEGGAVEPQVFPFPGDLEELDWTQHYSADCHYLVFGLLNEQYYLLGVVYNSVYRVKYSNAPSTNIFNSTLSGFTAYKVCEVTTRGSFVWPTVE